jgi:hypothetical protein
MSRPVFIIPFLALALQVSQAQFVTHGPPASVTSPTGDGQLHGVPSSVVSPTPVLNQQRAIRVRGPLRRFGSPHRRPVFVSIPVFYPIYGDSAYPSVADPYVPDSSADPAPATQAAATDRSQDRGDDELRAAYLQGARDALTSQGDSRYGEHYMDSRERRPAATKDGARRPASSPASSDERASAEPAAQAEDKSPAAVFIFKDGHQLETRNYAIMGGTLFDFSGKTLKKIQLDEKPMTIAA